MQLFFNAAIRRKQLTSPAISIISIVSKPKARRRNQLFSEVESHQGYLLRFARALMRDAAQAEEVVQEALLAALAGIDRFYGKSDFLRQLAVRYAKGAFAEGARVESAGCNTGKNVTRLNGTEDLPESDANDRP